MTYTFIFSIITIIFLIIFGISTNNIVSPINLFGIPVLLGFIIYDIYFSDTWLLSGTTIYYFIMGFISFFIGTMLFNMLFNRNNKLKKISAITKRSYINNYVWITYYIGIILTILCIIYLRNLHLSGDALRLFYIMNVSQMPFFVLYGKYILLFPLTIILYDSLINGWSKRKVITFILGVFILIFATLYTQARTDLLAALFPLVTIFVMTGSKKQKDTIKKYIPIGIILLILYEFLKIIQNARFNGPKTEFFSAQNQMFQYIGLPLVAFDKWYVAPNVAGALHGWGVVELFDKVRKLFGIVQPNISLAPLGQFNVYSYLAAPYAAFGFLGLIFCLFIAGFILTLIYNLAKQKEGLYIIFYALISGSILLEFYVWNFTSMVNLYALIYVIFYKIFMDISEKKNG